MQAVGKGSNVFKREVLPLLFRKHFISYFVMSVTCVHMCLILLSQNTELEIN